MKTFLTILCLSATPVLAADYGWIPPAPIQQQQTFIVTPNPSTMYEDEENLPPSLAVPRCHVVRDIEHDDILDTTDWKEHQICD